MQRHMIQVRVDGIFHQVIQFEVRQEIKHPEFIHNTDDVVFARAFFGHFELDWDGCKDQKAADCHLFGEVLVFFNIQGHQYNKHCVGSKFSEGREVALALARVVLRSLNCLSDKGLLLVVEFPKIWLLN